MLFSFLFSLLLFSFLLFNFSLFFVLIIFLKFKDFLLEIIDEIIILYIVDEVFVFIYILIKKNEGLLNILV